MAGDAFDDATRQAQHCEIGILLARNGVERHAQHEGREGGEQGEDVCRVRPAGQDQTGDAGCNVEEECDAGEPCVRRASHVYSALDVGYLLLVSSEGRSQ